MICPRCNNSLVISIINGVEIDHCPNCKGVWLDRGELDKIIEQSNNYISSSMFGNNHNEYRENNHDNHHDNRYEKHHDNHGYGNQSKHKKGFLADLFDF